MVMLRHDRFSLVPGLVVGVAGALFLAFVYGYPRLFPAIEAAHPDRFERNVDEALASGEVRKALRIAAFASRRHPPNPMALTVHGRLLLEHGNADDGLKELAKALEVRKVHVAPYSATLATMPLALVRVKILTSIPSGARPNTCCSIPDAECAGTVAVERQPARPERHPRPSATHAARAR